MSLKSLALTGMFCIGLMNSSLPAQPMVTVDLRRDAMGDPMLNADGNWEWLVHAVPDADLFGPTGEGVVGGSLAIEIGFRLFDASLVDVEVEINNFGDVNGNGVIDVGEGTPNPGEQIFSWEELTSGAGNQFPAGLQDTVHDDATAPFGPDAGLAEIFAAFGSRIFSTPGPKDFLTITTEGPSTAGSIKTTLEWLGAYGPDGDQGFIVQQDSQNETFAFTFPSGESYTALAGDANLDGNVDYGDVLVVSSNYLQTDNFIWSDGDFDRSGAVDQDDVMEIAANLNAATISAPPGTAKEGQSGDGTGDVIYFAETGMITINPDGESLGLFRLLSQGGIFDGMDDANLPAGGTLAVDNDHEIALADFAATSGPIELGLVARAGLSRNALLADLTLAGSGGLGTPNANLTLVHVPIPEPSAAALFMIGLAAAAGYLGRPMARF